MHRSKYKMTDQPQKVMIKWNPKMEKSIKEIGDKAKGYKIMHIQNSKKISQTYTYLMYLGICLGPTSALCGSIQSILDPDPPTFLSIFSVFIAFISGIMVAITKFGRYEEISSAHKLSASKYTGLESNIRRQLSLQRNDRRDASKYLDWVGNSFDELFMASPLINGKIYENYVNIAKKHNLTVPDEYGIIIEINEDYEDRKIKEITNTGDILINIGEQKEPEVKRHPTIKGNKKIKRTEAFAHFSNEYSDTRMNYEMQRLMNMTN